MFDDLHHKVETDTLTEIISTVVKKMEATVINVKNGTIIAVIIAVLPG